MMKQLALKAKLLVVFLCIGLTPFFILGGLTVFKVSNAYTSQVYRQLESLREIKKKQCQDLFKNYFKDISILAQTDFVKNALKALAGVVSSDKDRTKGEFYKAMAKNYAGSIDYFAKTSGYLDLLLIAANGDVVYTTAKQSELGANLLTGPLKTSPLGKCFDQSLKTQSLVDFEPYSAGNNEPAAFIGAPIKKKDKLLGSVVLRLSVASINAFMQQKEGMGATGETYLVGEDFRMRSDSPHDSEKHSVLASFANAEQGSVKTLSVRKALSGETGQIISKNYNNKAVLSSFAPLNIDGLKWAIIAEIEEAEAFGAVNALKWVLGVAGGLGVVFIVAIALLTTRSITLPIKRIIQSLNKSAENVSSAAGEISSGSQQLADGTGNQVASLEETSSSLEEMSSITKQNADHANEADGLMKNTNTMVGNAYGSLDKLTTSMKAVSKASEKTSKIIKTIDEIAFQTNLLALNAAVEAARAGEAGAGFAVVADEVRNLAIRAAEAARETAGLIESTMQKVNDGTSLVGHTNDAFGQVVESTSKVGELVGEIAGASNEQAQGIEQINSAVSEMDQVTQQNASTAEESYSASESMQLQAKELNTMVNQLVSIVEGTRNGTETKVNQPNARRWQRFNKRRKAQTSTQTAQVTNHSDEFLSLDA